MLRVDAPALKAMLADGQELALIDLREELIFSQNHLLFARSVPLSRLELTFARLVPRRGTRVVLCDEADGLAERAAEILAHASYTNQYALAGGVAGWAKAGFELFSGVNVPSKAFGEFVEPESSTPRISAEELARLMHERGDIVVLDSRPFDEYHRVSIPSAVNVPGAELVLRIRDLAPSPETLVVVNCAGRTRSIIGAQSLINAGVPNKVLALRNGTMGWTLAGLACESGKAERAPEVSRDGLAWAKAAAERVARQLRIDCGNLAALTARNEATIVDLSLSREYVKAHIPGAWFAIRSRLAQALAKIPLAGTLVLTSEDGALAGRAVGEARALTDRAVRALDGGNATWRAAGHVLTAEEPRMADEAVDVWLKPYERAREQTAAMREYLSWEVDLPARIARDGSANFMRFGA